MRQEQQRQAQHVQLRLRRVQPQLISLEVARLQVCPCRCWVCFRRCLCHCLSHCQVYHDLEQSTALAVARCAVGSHPAQLLQRLPLQLLQLATHPGVRVSHGWRS